MNGRKKRITGKEKYFYVTGTVRISEHFNAVQRVFNQTIFVESKQVNNKNISKVKLVQAKLGE